MKKLLVLMLVVTLLTGCTGCSSKEQDVPEPAETTEEAAVEDLRETIDDEEYWSSLDRVSELIEKTVEERVSLNVSFRLENSSDGKEIILEEIYADNLSYEGDVWLSIFKNNLIQSLSTSEPVVKAHEAGEKLEITGVILKWAQQPIDEELEQNVFSVGDLSGDGTWDYVTIGKVFFAENSKLSTLKNEDGKLLGIDEIEDKRVKLVEESNPKLERLAEIASEK